MSAENLPQCQRARKRTPHLEGLPWSERGRLALHATWLEARARRGPTVTISAAFANELAAILRQRTRERAA